MTNEEREMRKGLLIGVLAGTLIGSIIALLYYSKTGKKLPMELGTKSCDSMKDAKSQYELQLTKAEGKIAEKCDESKNITNDIKENGAKSIKTGKTKSKKASKHSTSSGKP
jgi:gas vesicle protein